MPTAQVPSANESNVNQRRNASTTTSGKAMDCRGTGCCFIAFGICLALGGFGVASMRLSLGAGVFLLCVGISFAVAGVTVCKRQRKWRNGRMQGFSDEEYAAAVADEGSNRSQQDALRRVVVSTAGDARQGQTPETVVQVYELWRVDPAAATEDNRVFVGDPATRRLDSNPPGYDESQAPEYSADPPTYEEVVGKKS